MSAGGRVGLFDVLAFPFRVLGLALGVVGSAAAALFAAGEPLPREEVIP